MFIGSKQAEHGKTYDVMRALVLSGGAVRGAYQVGVLKRWMGEQGIDYDIMCGISVGALNIAGLAQFPMGEGKSSIEFVEKLWREKINTEAIYTRWKPFGRLHALKKSSIYDSTPLANLVRDNLRQEAVANSGRRIAVGAVCLETGEFKYGRQNDPEFSRWVLASSSFPIFLRPIEIDGKLWCDGGLRHIAPLREAIRMGADEIDVIMCSNPSLVSEWKAAGRAAVPDVLIRTMELITDQILRADIQLAGIMNDTAVRRENHRHIKIRVIQPKIRLVTNAMNFDPVEIAKMIDLGYNDADDCVIYNET